MIRRLSMKTYHANSAVAVFVKIVVSGVKKGLQRSPAKWILPFLFP
jgi:hypothetical protein